MDGRTSPLEAFSQKKLLEINAHAQEKGAMAEGQRSTGVVYTWTPPQIHIQLLKMNTFNENKQIFTKDNNSKGNDNNAK